MRCKYRHCQCCLCWQRMILLSWRFQCFALKTPWYLLDYTCIYCINIRVNHRRPQGRIAQAIWVFFSKKSTYLILSYLIWPKSEEQNNNKLNWMISMCFASMSLFFNCTKFIKWTQYVKRKNKIECCQFSSIFASVMPLLELQIFDIQSFLHFPLTCFDILSWQFVYDFL